MAHIYKYKHPILNIATGLVAVSYLKVMTTSCSSTIVMRHMPGVFQTMVPAKHMPSYIAKLIYWQTSRVSAAKLSAEIYLMVMVRWLGGMVVFPNRRCWMNVRQWV